MLNQIYALVLRVMLALRAPFVEEPRRLRDDERGVSPVVATVLLILVAVLAVLLLWNLLGSYINELWDNITNQDDGLKPYNT